MRGTDSFSPGSLLTALCACAVTGCTSMPIGSSYSTAEDPPANTRLSGVPYSLPKAMLTVALVRDANGISVEVGEPVYGPDSAATYLLKYTPSFSSKDKFNVGVDPATSLLTSLGAEAEDQSDEALIALAKTVGAVKYEAAVMSPQRQVLFEGTFDPAADDTQPDNDITRINLALSTAVSNASTVIARDCDVALQVMTPEQRKGPQPAVCTLSSKWPGATFQLDVRGYTAFAYKKDEARAPCTVGFCTRVLQPAVLRILAGGREIGSQPFNMPNGSDPVPVQLQRAAFVKATHAITLRNGLIQSSEVNKESGALALANLPFEILKALFAAPAELIQLKVDLTGKQKALLDAEKDKLVAEKDKLVAEKALEDARKGVVADPGKAESSVAGGADSGSVLLMKAVLPGLGRGSGAELPEPPAIENTQETGFLPDRGQPQPRQGNCTSELGGPCTESADGQAR
jgi:hypothetical protein